MVGQWIVEDGLERPTSARSASVDVASRRRRSPFGVITTSGRAVASSACLRSRWKNCAGGRAVDDADVVLGGELEEALEPRARVLRSVALVAMRKEQGESRRLTPLRATRDDELVDDDLRAVDEVSELRLPQHERVGRRDRVAVLERERRVLGERRVVDLERRGRGRKVLQRRVRLSRRRVVEHRVPVGERAALRVLARDPDRDALLEERSRMRAPPRGPSRFRLRERVSRRRSSCRASLAFTSKPSGARRSCSLSSSRRSAGTAVMTAAPVSVRVGASAGGTGAANDCRSSS